MGWVSLGAVSAAARTTRDIPCRRWTATAVVYSNGYSHNLQTGQTAKSAVGRREHFPEMEEDGCRIDPQNGRAQGWGVRKWP